MARAAQTKTMTLFDFSPAIENTVACVIVRDTVLAHCCSSRVSYIVHGEGMQVNFLFARFHNLCPRSLHLEPSDLYNRQHGAILKSVT